MATLRSFDFRIAPLGPAILLEPLTRAARNWIHDHLPPTERRLGPSAIIPAARITDTLTSILLDGLTIAPPLT